MYYELITHNGVPFIGAAGHVITTNVVVVLFVKDPLLKECRTALARTHKRLSFEVKETL